MAKLSARLTAFIAGESPMSILANSAGVPWMSIPLDLFIALSTMAMGITVLSFGGRTPLGWPITANRIAIDEPETIRVADRPFPERVRPGQHLAGRIGRRNRIAGGLGGLDKGRIDLGNQDGYQIIAGRVVAVDRGGRHAHLASDCAQRDGVGPAFGQQRPGDRLDLLGRSRPQTFSSSEVSHD